MYRAGGELFNCAIYLVSLVVAEIFICNERITKIWPQWQLCDCSLGLGARMLNKGGKSVHLPYPMKVWVSSVQSQGGYVNLLKEIQNKRREI